MAIFRQKSDHTDIDRDKVTTESTKSKPVYDGYWYVDVIGASREEREYGRGASLVRFGPPIQRSLYAEV